MRRTQQVLVVYTLLLGTFGIIDALAQQPQKEPPPDVAQHSAAQNGTQKIVAQGVQIEFSITPLASDTKQGRLMEEGEALVRFRISDAATQTPLAGVRPSVWLTRREGTAADPQACRNKIQSFLQGSLRARPDVDLNSYYVLALNQEPNISVIDPLLGFGGSKLVTLVLLRSPGEDWVITNDQGRLFVSMPGVNQVAVVDTKTWKVVAHVDTGSKPRRLVLQPDEKYLWVGTESGVTIVDATTWLVVSHVAAGMGPHEIALGRDNKFAYVVNRDGTLSVVNVQKLAKAGEVKVGSSASGVSFSPLSKAVYISDEAAGQIVVIDERNPKILARIAVQPGVGRVRFAPDGRYGFAPNPADGVVYVFDAATNRLLHTAAVGKGPDQIAFTRDFAYVRSAGEVDVTMLRLSTIGKSLDVVKFPGGQKASSDSASAPGIAEAIVPTPEGNSVFVANTADRQIYYYTEGMAAPMGNFQNYRRDPRAVLVIDRSLREMKTGVYETVSRLPRAGIYDVAFLLDAPRVTHCFEARADVNPNLKRDTPLALRVEYLTNDKPLKPGEDYGLRFRLFDTVTNKPKDGLTDVQVLTFLTPGIWQRRAFARGLGNGIYELHISVPQTGVYMVFVESRSQGVTFRQLPSLTLHAGRTSSPADAPAAP